MCEPEIDPGIRRLVDLLNDVGFPTIGSCEGGEGHQFARPTVQVRPPGDLDNARKRLAEFLIKRGAQGFTLRTVCLHQKSAEPEEYSFVELEFWGQPIFM